MKINEYILETVLESVTNGNEMVMVDKKRNKLQTSAIDVVVYELFLGFTQSQEIQKTIVIAAMLESQTKEIIKILLLRVLQHGRHDVR